tara:strand:- start:7282 stop:10398 length:3117 start_codon:yes stop_codon:yes gene_type:complete
MFSQGTQFNLGGLNNLATNQQGTISPEQEQAIKAAMMKQAMQKQALSNQQGMMQTPALNQQSTKSNVSTVTGKTWADMSNLERDAHRLGMNVDIDKINPNQMGAAQEWLNAKTTNQQGTISSSQEQAIKAAMMKQAMQEQALSNQQGMMQTNASNNGMQASAPSPYADTSKWSDANWATALEGNLPTLNSGFYSNLTPEQTQEILKKDPNFFVKLLKNNDSAFTQTEDKNRSSLTNYSGPAFTSTDDVYSYMDSLGIEDNLDAFGGRTGKLGGNGGFMSGGSSLKGSNTDTRAVQHDFVNTQYTQQGKMPVYQDGDAIYVLNTGFGDNRPDLGTDAEGNKLKFDGHGGYYHKSGGSKKGEYQKYVKQSKQGPDTDAFFDQVMPAVMSAAQTAFLTPLVGPVAAAGLSTATTQATYGDGNFDLGEIAKASASAYVNNGLLPGADAYGGGLQGNILEGTVSGAASAFTNQAIGGDIDWGQVGRGALLGGTGGALTYTPTGPDIMGPPAPDTYGMLGTGIQNPVKFDNFVGDFSRGAIGDAAGQFITDGSVDLSQALTSGAVGLGKGAVSDLFQDSYQTRKTGLQGTDEWSTGAARIDGAHEGWGEWTGAGPYNGVEWVEGLTDKGKELLNTTDFRGFLGPNGALAQATGLDIPYMPTDYLGNTFEFLQDVGLDALAPMALKFAFGENAGEATRYDERFFDIFSDRGTEADMTGIWTTNPRDPSGTGGFGGIDIAGNIGNQYSQTAATPAIANSSSDAPSGESWHSGRPDKWSGPDAYQAASFTGNETDKIDAAEARDTGTQILDDDGNVIPDPTNGGLSGWFQDALGITTAVEALTGETTRKNEQEVLEAAGLPGGPPPNSNFLDEAAGYNSQEGATNALDSVFGEEGPEDLNSAEVQEVINQLSEEETAAAEGPNVIPEGPNVIPEGPNVINKYNPEVPPVLPPPPPPPGGGGGGGGKQQKVEQDNYMIDKELWRLARITQIISLSEGDLASVQKRMAVLREQKEAIAGDIVGAVQKDSGKYLKQTYEDDARREKIRNV